MTSVRNPVRLLAEIKNKKLLNSETFKRIAKMNCQKMFQTPGMRSIPVKLPLGERTRPCMLACFESTAQKTQRLKKQKVTEK